VLIRRGHGRYAKPEGAPVRMLIQLADDRMGELLILTGAILLIAALSMGFLF